MPRSTASSPAGPEPADSEPAAWRSSAACAGFPPQVVFSKGLKQARRALRACARCRVRRECEEVVAPAATWFDGVCAGRLWHNGRAVATTWDLQREEI